MADEESEGSDGGGSQDGSLQDHITHWVDVLDRWVKRMDSALGNREADVASTDGDGRPGTGVPPVDEGDEFTKGLQG
jgi:hypothetical protein